MLPTAVRCSKASRRALTSKRANKDFYKGTRQAYLPGGRRTGPPGIHVVKGKAKYKLLDTQVRVFIAPSIETLSTTPLRPYVAAEFKLSRKETKGVGVVNGPGMSHGARLIDKLKREGLLLGESTWADTAGYPEYIKRKNGDYEDLVEKGEVVHGGIERLESPPGTVGDTPVSAQATPAANRA